MSYINIYLAIHYIPIHFSKKDRQFVETTIKKWIPKYKIIMESQLSDQGEMVFSLTHRGDKILFYENVLKVLEELEDFHPYLTTPPVKEDS